MGLEIIKKEIVHTNNNDKLKFVVQKHNTAESGLHYDLRLEHNGMLLGWVLQKLPPIGFGVKRLAIPVCGHPLSWGEFCGTIKQGFGKGTVRIWDKGELEWETEQPPFNFILKGEKLRGRYSLMPNQKNFLFYRIE